MPSTATQRLSAGLDFMVFAVLAAILAPAAKAAQFGGPVLYIGDSISDGGFGTALDADIRQLSSKVVTEASCGSSPANWLIAGQGYAKTVCGYWQRNEDGSQERENAHQTPKLTEQLASVHPAVTVVQLGTNIAVAADPNTQSASVIQMMKTIRSSGSRCIWIGPPTGNSPKAGITPAKLQTTNDMIQADAKAQGCDFISALDLTRGEAPPASLSDGIHPPPDLAAQWAGQVNAQLTPLIAKDLSAESSSPGSGTAPVSSAPGASDSASGSAPAR